MGTMDLNPEQRDAVEAEGPLAVIASAGTGKTTVLTRRFVRHLAQGLPPARLLAFTFTEKAAREMKERILASAELGPEALPELNVSTMHAFCGDVLRRHGDLLGLSSDFAVLDERAHAAMTRRRFKTFANRALTEGVPAFAEFYSRYGSLRLFASMEELNRVNLVLLEGRALSCRLDGDDGAMTAFVAANKELQEMLLRERVENGTLSYDDLETLVIRLFRDHPSVKRKLQQRFDRILVDEFQDTSPRQFEILKHLFDPGCNSLFAVGDPKQAIYGFRHADAFTFQGLQDLVLQAGGRVIVLTRTFRTPRRLQSFFNAAFPMLLNREGTALYYAAVTENPEEGLVAAATSASSGASEEEEIETIAGRVADFVTGLTRAGEEPSSIAILAPTRKHFKETEKALEARGIPVVAEKRSDHFDEDLALLFFHALNALSGRHDPVTISGLLRNPLVGFGEAFLAALLSCGAKNPLTSPDTAAPAAASPEETSRWTKLRETWHGLAEAAVHLSASEVCASLFHVLLPDADARHLKIFAEFSAILESWRRQGAFSASGAAELLRELAEGGAQTKTPESEEAGVRLLTVHGAKGLEFGHVLVLPGGRDAPSRVPFLWDKNLGFAFKTPANGPETGLAAELENSAAYAELKTALEPLEHAETARLAYVALTRSRGRLYLFPDKARGKEFAAALAKNPDDTAPVKTFNDWLYWLAGRPEVEKGVPVIASRPGPPAPSQGGPVPVDPPETDDLKKTNVHPVPKPSLSVTALETFARCPKKFQLAYVENRAPSIRRKFSRARKRVSNASGNALKSLDPAERGTLLHEILQFYDPARGNLDEVVNQALFNQRLADEDGAILAACREFAAKLHADPETDATLFRGRETHRELEFSLELESFVLSGQIDKVALIPASAGTEEWVVIDYKTHALRSEKEAAALTEEFAFQLKCYALAVARRFGQAEVSAAVAFTATGKIRRMRFSESDLRSFETELEETRRRWQDALLKREFAFTREPESCEKCPYSPGNDCGVRRDE